MVTAHATEIVLAVPPTLQDIYQLHQAVWSQVDRAQAVRHRPVILYRQDRGLVRVRVSDCAILRGRGQPDRASFEEGQSLDWQVRLALWRDDTSPTHNIARDAEARIVALLESAGVVVDDLSFSTGLAMGQKQAHGIRLPVADVQARVRIVDAARARDAWIHGLGRGRRFGFGMLMAG